uniref:Uncharacterized protein n=1 Tax=Arundo donax TaxID=35708 RepID=A0A0A8XPY1_ARUDO
MFKKVMTPISTIFRCPTVPTVEILTGGVILNRYAVS